ncbi:hypothetical protein TRVL_03372 [Trypanosoma vivax]|nr:hypothetical protein TRVL_03372 [Trypanosoma vivax]
MVDAPPCERQGGEHSTNRESWHQTRLQSVRRVARDAIRGCPRKTEKTTGGKDTLTGVRQQVAHKWNLQAQRRNGGNGWGAMGDRTKLKKHKEPTKKVDEGEVTRIHEPQEDKGTDRSNWK